MPYGSSPAHHDASRLADLARDTKFVLMAAEVQSRSIIDVAYDSFAFEPEVLVKGAVLLERGVDDAETTVAVASLPWADMAVPWTTLQSHGGADHLGLLETMQSVGHPQFDHAYALDTDDVDEFRNRFLPSTLDWLVRFEQKHGPLTVIFDGNCDDDDPHPAAVFVARIVTDDEAFLTTADIAEELLEYLQSSMLD